MADNKITLEEMGAIQKKRNPKNFSHMTDLEAGKRSLRKTIVQVIPNREDFVLLSPTTNTKKVRAKPD